jgi:hypothetical protein
MVAPCFVTTMPLSAGSTLATSSPQIVIYITDAAPNMTDAAPHMTVAAPKALKPCRWHKNY